MSDAEKKPEAAPAGGGSSKSRLILPLLSTLTVLVALGMLVYTKLIFKRPPITEDAERKRLTKLNSTPTPPPTPSMVTFDAVTVNIQGSGPRPKPSADGSAENKLHYVTVGFGVELRDGKRQDEFENYKPVFMDRVLNLLSHKSYDDLITVQGRYIVKSQILDIANGLVEQKKNDAPKPPMATNVYFTQFTVQ